jgi:hypothetical protein
VQDRQSLIEYVDAICNPVEGFLCVQGYWDEAIDYGQRALGAAQQMIR